MALEQSLGGSHFSLTAAYFVPFCLRAGKSYLVLIPTKLTVKNTKHDVLGRHF